MVKLRKFRKADTKEVALLVMKTFKLCNIKESEKSVGQGYIDRLDPTKHTIKELCENFKRTPIFYVAVENNRVIGMIRGRPFRIGNLFVDVKHHKKGIGKLLVDKFESEAKRQRSKEIKIRSSLYAAPFYQKMGYKKTTGIRTLQGLNIYPMKKVLVK